MSDGRDRQAETDAAQMIEDRARPQALNAEPFSVAVLITATEFFTSRFNLRRVSWVPELEVHCPASPTELIYTNESGDRRLACGKARVQYDGVGQIWLAPWADTVDVLHEVAHLLDWTVDSRTEEEQHGPYWADTLLSLARADHRRD